MLDLEGPDMQLKNREKTRRNKNAEGKSDTIPLTFCLLFGPDKGI